MFRGYLTSESTSFFATIGPGPQQIEINPTEIPEFMFSHILNDHGIEHGDAIVHGLLLQSLHRVTVYYKLPPRVCSFMEASGMGYVRGPLEEQASFRPVLV